MEGSVILGFYQEPCGNLVNNALKDFMMQALKEDKLRIGPSGSVRTSIAKKSNL